MQNTYKEISHALNAAALVVNCSVHKVYLFRVDLIR